MAFHNIPEQPQEAHELLGLLLSERTRSQLGWKPKSLFEVLVGVFVVVQVQVDKLSQRSSHLQVHRNCLEVSSKYGLQGPPPKFLFRELWVGSKNSHF